MTTTKVLEMSLTLRCLIPPFAMFAMASAHAQADPDQPSAAGAMLDAQHNPVLQYRSALAGYRAWKDQPVSDWREANEVTGRIGGWRAYAREARQPDPSPAGGADSLTPIPAGPADHGTKQ